MTVETVVAVVVGVPAVLYTIVTLLQRRHVKRRGPVLHKTIPLRPAHRIAETYNRWEYSDREGTKETVRRSTAPYASKTVHVLPPRGGAA
jgi:hypothetical protein